MELSGRKDIAKMVADVLTRGGMKVTHVAVLGHFLHIDTFDKYAQQIREILYQSGWDKITDSNKYHMDGFKGMRVSAVFTGHSVDKRVV